MTRDRRGPQVALAMVMVLALGAVVLARLPDGVNRAGALDPTPSATVLESPVSPRVSPIPTTSATPRPSPTPEPSASPEPTEAAPETYTVRSGDTLSAIAARYGTTVAVLQELNGIVDASKIRIGQVIRLP